MEGGDEIVIWLERFYKGEIAKRVALVVTRRSVGREIEDLVESSGYSSLTYSATSPALHDFIKDLSGSLVSPFSVSTLFKKIQKKQVVIIEDLNCLKTNHPRAFSALAKLGRLKASRPGEIPIICTATSTSDKLLTCFKNNSTPIDLTQAQNVYTNGYLQKTDSLLNSGASLVEIQHTACVYDPTILALIMYESVGSYVHDQKQRQHYIELLDSLCRGDAIDFQAFKAHQPQVGQSAKTSVLASVLYQARKIEPTDALKLKFSKILTKASSAKSLATLMKAKCNALGLKSRELEEKIRNNADMQVSKGERVRLERLYS